MYSQGGQLLYGLRLPSGGSAADTLYFYLGGKLIAEDGTAGIQYVHTDALGSPVAKTNAGGALLSRTRYEPYGKTAAGSRTCSSHPGNGACPCGDDSTFIATNAGTAMSMTSPPVAAAVSEPPSA